MTSGISFGGVGHLACVQCGLKKKKEEEEEGKERKGREVYERFLYFLVLSLFPFFPLAALDKNRVVSRSANPAVDHDSGSFRQ